MLNLWEKVCFVVKTHKAVSIAVGSCVLASAAGVTGYEVYNSLNNAPETEVVEEVEEVADEEVAAAVELPEFKQVFISTASVEKDLSIYFTDVDDQPITDVAFTVKLVSEEDLEKLQPYVEAIQAINKQIKDITGEVNIDTGEEAESTEDADATDDASEEKTSDDASADSKSETDTTETDKNLVSSVTVLDENGEVISEEEAEDPLVQLYQDKEVAIQAYGLALDAMEGDELVDEDMDGEIKVDTMEEGDYTLCLEYDANLDVNMEPTVYETVATVKGELEYEVVENITKEIKKDVASEDGGKVEETVVESVPTDTVAWVESSDTVTATYTATTDAAKPGYTYSVSSYGSTETMRNNGYSYTTTESVAKHTIKVEEIRYKNDGTTVESTTTLASATIYDGSTYTVTAPSTPSGYDAMDSSTPATNAILSGDVTYTFKFKNQTADNAEETETPAETNSEAFNGYFKNGAFATRFGKPFFSAIASKVLKFAEAVSSTGYLSYEEYTPKTTDYTDTVSMTFNFHDQTLAISKTESRDGIIQYYTVNGTKIDGSTYKITDAGTYTVVAQLLYGDGTSGTLSGSITFTGKPSSDTAALLDSNGNQLYKDENGTAATAADYVAGGTYYLKTETHKYTGWQYSSGATYYYDADGNVVTGTQVIQGVTYNFGSDGALLVSGTGIDVSKYQGSIDWSQASSAVSFAIIRCGYRGMYDGALHEDPYFYKNMKNAKANGVSVGVYIYSTALNEAEAVEEASMAVAMAQAAGGCSYPIFIDMEDSTRGVKSLSADEKTAIINAFCTTVANAGYKTGVYANKTWLTKYINTSGITSSAYIWVAQYNTSCTYSGKYSIWQYSSKGSVPGISGNVDVNKAYF